MMRGIGRFVFGWAAVLLPFVALHSWGDVAAIGRSTQAALGLVASLGAILLFLRRSGSGFEVFPALGFGSLGVALLLNQSMILTFFPALLNLTAAGVFLGSLRDGREPLVLQFAARSGERITPLIVRYCRRVTATWGIVLLCNAVLSFGAWFISERAWVLYNGCFSYILIGFVFCAEYAVRLLVKSRNRRSVAAAEG